MKKRVTNIFLFFAMVLTRNAQWMDGILKKYYDALGGLDNLKSVNTIIQEGVFSPARAEAEFQVTIIKKRPNKWISTMEIQGQKIIQAYDGKSAWMQNPMMGMIKPTVLQGDQAKQVIRQAHFDGDLVNYKQNGTDIKIEGVAPFEGVDCYKLRATRSDSQQVIFYIDNKNNLLIGTEVPVNTPQEKTTVTIRLGDYEEIDGLLYPHSLEILGAQKMDFVFDDIQINTDIPDATFAMPAGK